MTKTAIKNSLEEIVGTTATSPSYQTRKEPEAEFNSLYLSDINLQSDIKLDIEENVIEYSVTAVNNKSTGYGQVCFSYTPAGEDKSQLIERGLSLLTITLTPEGSGELDVEVQYALGRDVDENSNKWKGVDYFERNTFDFKKLVGTKHNSIHSIHASEFLRNADLKNKTKRDKYHSVRARLVVKAPPYKFYDNDGSLVHTVGGVQHSLITVTDWTVAEFTVPRSIQVIYRKPVKKEVHYDEDGMIEYEIDSEGNPIFDQFDRCIQLIQARKHILMVGPAGSGKTFSAKQLYNELCADELLPEASQRFHSVSCSEGMTENQLAGWLLPVDDGGKFSHVSVGFIDCYEKGGVFFFDELDACDPNVLMFINKALANDEFEVPSRYDNPIVKKHKDFICIAAANTFGYGGDDIYSARNSLDAATLDRFRAGIIQIGYSDVLEQVLVDKDVYEWGIEIRKRIIKAGLSKIMSTRIMLDFTRMSEEFGWDSDDWGQSYFADWSENELAAIEAEVI